MIAAGRIEFLQDRITNSIIRAYDIDYLSDSAIRHIFRDLLDDVSIESMIYMRSKLIIKKKVNESGESSENSER